MTDPRVNIGTINAGDGGVGVAIYNYPSHEHALEDGHSSSPSQRPTYLLNARYQVVAFHEESRRQELDFLQRWCDDDRELFDLHLWHGPGGSGKTRLMIEWSRRVRAQGWQAGFLKQPSLGLNGALEGGPTPEALRELGQSGGKLLVVVDYAETRAGLGEALTHIFEGAESAGTRVRVVLLARQVGDWWQVLKSSTSMISELLTYTTPQPLLPIQAEGGARRDVFEHALRCFSACTKQTPPAYAAPDLSHKRYGRTLYLHMLALAVLNGWDTGVTRLLSTILEHERRFWTRTFQPARSDGFLPETNRLMAALTLRGGAPDRQAALALASHVGGPTEPRVIDFLHSHYRVLAGPDGAPASYIHALEPDLLGEALVTDVLRSSPDATAWLDQVFQGASPDIFFAGLTLLGRITLSFRDARPWTQHILSKDITSRAIPALRAALSLGEESAHATLGQDLTDALERASAYTVAPLLALLLPEQTVSLRELALWTTQAQLHYQGSISNEERAHLTNNMGLRFSGLGLHEQALGAAQEATDLYQQLAQHRPDTFLPDLAASIHNLGGRLSALGRREDALEAAQKANNLYSRLAQLRPDAFLPDLAMSLNNLGPMLSALGRHEDALEAAQKATELYRQLAQQHPDAYLPYLAMSLLNLGPILSGLGRREQALEAAQEATNIRSQLAQLRPDTFLPDLAASIHNLGAMLNVLGCHENALEAAQEATNIRRQLAQLRPDAFLPDLAMSLHNLGTMLSELGRREQALEASREGVQLYQRCFEAIPAAFGQNFMISLRGYMERLTALGIDPESDETLLAAVMTLQRHGGA